jgi:hypothetical protein
MAYKSTYVVLLLTPVTNNFGSPLAITAGVAVAGIGLAHFAWPTRFEPLNESMGFTQRTRRHVYINGAIETLLGLTMVSPRTRTLNIVLSIAYPTYLAANIIRARRDR